MSAETKLHTGPVIYVHRVSATFAVRYLTAFDSSMTERDKFYTFFAAKIVDTAVFVKVPEALNYATKTWPGAPIFYTGGSYHPLDNEPNPFDFMAPDDLQKWLTGPVAVTRPEISLTAPTDQPAESALVISLPAFRETRQIHYVPVEDFF